MADQEFKNLQIAGVQNKPLLLDLYFEVDRRPKWIPLPVEEHRVVRERSVPDDLSGAQLPPTSSYRDR